MTPTQDYLQKCHQLAEVVSKQETLIQQAATVFSKIYPGRTDGARIWLRSQPDYGRRNVAALWIISGI